MGGVLLLFGVMIALFTCDLSLLLAQLALGVAGWWIWKITIVSKLRSAAAELRTKVDAERRFLELLQGKGKGPVEMTEELFRIVRKQEVSRDGLRDLIAKHEAQLNEIDRLVAHQVPLAEKSALAFGLGLLIAPLATLIGVAIYFVLWLITTE